MSWPAACPTLCFAASLRFIAQNFKPTIAQPLPYYHCHCSLCDSVNFHQVSSNNTSCLSYSHDGQNWNIYSRLWVQFLCTFLSFHFFEESKSSEEIQKKTACNIMCVAASADMNYCASFAILSLTLNIAVSSIMSIFIKF